MKLLRAFRRLNRLPLLLLALLLASFSVGCGGKDEENVDSQVQVDVVPDQAVPADTSDDFSVPTDELATPVDDPAAAARAFRLYYAERLERSLVAYNRFQLFGDVTFGTTIGKAAIAREGEQWEVVGGPKDNNHIGESMWTVWNAYKVFRTRTVELTMIRMLEGLVFYESVSGHPGLTARSVYPGWTRVVDGNAGTVVRTRNGATVTSPTPADPALEAEMIAAFYAGGTFTYREDPEDILLAYMPTAEMDEYCVTYSFNMLPDFLRVSDCCASLKRVPETYPWGGGYFSNHNSRDNFPDIAIGYLVAKEAMNDAEASPELRDAAARAWAAAQRTGDLIQENGGNLMTVDEHNPYDVLVISGAVRPHGAAEKETLGSLSDCQMVFLSKAISTEGLSMPLPELPAPGSVEYLMEEVVGESECPIPEPVRLCTRLNDGYCGKTWATMDELKFMGQPWLDVIEELEKGTPGTAKELIGSFQDDFTEKTLAALALVYVAQLSGNAEFIEEARVGLAEITQLMRRFGELIWGQTDPSSLADRIYRMAIYESSGGIETPLADFGDFAMAEDQMVRLEGLLETGEAAPKPLVTDEEIKAQAEAQLGSMKDSVVERYTAAYGDTPPLRRAGEGYEARTFHEGALTEWHAVENQHHQVVGGFHLLEAMPLCVSAPHLLDCTWARLGCARPDLDANGVVDAADQGLFDTAKGAHVDTKCGSANQWCGGADLDHTGAVDSTDSAFMQAAQGCHYTPANP